MTRRYHQHTPIDPDYQRLLAEVADSAVIRQAEDLVSTSWATELRDAQQRSQQNLSNLRAARNLIARRLRDAQLNREPASIAAAQTELESANITVAHATINDHELRLLTLEQLDQLTHAAKHRVDEAIADQRRLTQALQAGMQ